WLALLSWVCTSPASLLWAIPLATPLTTTGQPSLTAAASASAADRQRTRGTVFTPQAASSSRLSGSVRAPPPALRGRDLGTPWAPATGGGVKQAAIPCRQVSVSTKNGRPAALIRALWSSARSPGTSTTTPLPDTSPARMAAWLNSSLG